MERDEIQEAYYELAGRGRRMSKFEFPFSNNIDLKSVPGFVGEVADWIEGQSRFSRKKLSVLAALVTCGAVVSMRHTDEYNTRANVLGFGVAASSTGKESIQEAQKTLLKCVDLNRASYGGIKSSAEIVRNIVRHQPCIYLIDEFGKKLEKIVRSEKGGGSDYLATVIAEVMQIYSCGTSEYYLVGDDKMKLIEETQKRIAHETKKLDAGQGSESKLEELKKQLRRADDGVSNPLLTMSCYTTGETFSHLMTHDMVTSGFIGRCLIAVEKDTNPKPKKNHVKPKLGDNIKSRLHGVLTGGEFSMLNERIEYYRDRIIVPYDDDAKELLDKIIDWIYNDLAENCAKHGQIEAVARRCCELMLKINLILGAFSGRITKEMVNWSISYVYSDINTKSIMVMSNDSDAFIRGVIMSKLDNEKYVLASYVKNHKKLRSLKLADVEQEIQKLMVMGKVESIQDEKTKLFKYRLTVK